MSKSTRILSLVATLLLIVSAVWGGISYTFIHSATQTTGQVIGLETQGRGFSPRIQFTTEAGEVLDFKPMSSQSPSPYQVGDTVTVYYFPEAPEAAKLGSFISLWFGPMMLGIAGFINAVLALALKRR